MALYGFRFPRSIPSSVSDVGVASSRSHPVPIRFGTWRLSTPDGGCQPTKRRGPTGNTPHDWRAGYRMTGSSSVVSAAQSALSRSSSGTRPERSSPVPLPSTRPDAICNWPSFSSAWCLSCRTDLQDAVLSSLPDDGRRRPAPAWTDLGAPAAAAAVGRLRGAWRAPRGTDGTADDHIRARRAAFRPVPGRPRDRNGAASTCVVAPHYPAPCPRR